MGKNHNYSFFGQKTGMIFNAARDDLNFYLKFLKKKDSGTWEKPSQKEGKSFKFNIEEAICILKVLKRDQEEWSTYHSFKESKTSIKISWDVKGNLWFNCGDRNKGLNLIQAELLALLMEHIIKEQIEFGTAQQFKKSNDSQFEELD